MTYDSTHHAQRECSCMLYLSSGKIISHRYWRERREFLDYINPTMNLLCAAAEVTSTVHQWPIYIRSPLEPPPDGLPALKKSVGFEILGEPVRAHRLEGGPPF